MLPSLHVEGGLLPKRVDFVARIDALRLELHHDPVDQPFAGFLVDDLTECQPPLQGGDQFPSISPRSASP